MIIVYTAIFDNYDKLRPIKNKMEDTRYICFTDNVNIFPSGWEIVLDLSEESPSLKNRRYKIMPHRHIPKCDLSVYIDGNVELLSSLEPVVSKLLNSDKDFAAPKHPFRKCLYDEANACVLEKKAEKNEVSELIDFYKNNGFPRGLGLCEMNIIVRKSSKKNEALCESWWDCLVNGVKRDQLSFMYCVWKNEFDSLLFLDVRTRSLNTSFFIHRHHHSNVYQRLRCAVKYYLCLLYVKIKI